MDLQTYLRQSRGAIRKLALAIGVTPPFLSQCAVGARKTPGDRCTAIEQATAGAVTCEELRKDMAWVRITDPDWPWHPNGRPLLDLTAAQTPGAVAADDARQAA